jgi:hypothetical protein
MAKPYAYVCSACQHLASRHLVGPGTLVTEGLYTCTYNGCDCQITQTHAMYGIDEAAFNRLHLPHLESYGQLM